MLCPGFLAWAFEPFPAAAVVWFVVDVRWFEDVLGEDFLDGYFSHGRYALFRGGLTPKLSNHQWSQAGVGDTHVPSTKVPGFMWLSGNAVFQAWRYLSCQLPGIA